jgi:hypothetical protein
VGCKPKFDETWSKLTRKEYEARQTPESKLVKVRPKADSGVKTDDQDLDRLELALQAVEYERCMSQTPGTS